MAEVLKPGDPVVDFELVDATGLRRRSADARRAGLLLFAFWKRTCPVCQYTLPFLQRLHDRYAGETFRVWGIAQENADDTAAFAEQYGLTFPQLVDERLDVTEAYHLTNVPTLYLVDASGAIVRHALGFVRDELNEMARLAAERTGRPFVAAVRDEDNAPALRPG